MNDDIINNKKLSLISRYKCKSHPKTTPFTRKKERSLSITKKNFNNINNTFYNNHYPIKREARLIIDRTERETYPTHKFCTKFNNKLNPGGVNNKAFCKINTEFATCSKYCINCGNHGHTRGQCSEPNISNGIVAVRHNSYKECYEYLIVMRKHSHGYCDLVRGKYPDSLKHINQLLEETTLEERNYLMNHDFKTNWSYLWGKNNEILHKFKNTTLLENKFYNIRNKYFGKLFDSISSNWSEPEWGFPKGQRDGYEKNIETALREFSEESGYSKKICECVSNVVPLQENFIGSNNKSYKQMYFLALMNYEDTCGMINYQEDEIGGACWATIDEVLTKFRNYDKSKIDIIKNVNELLRSSFFVFV